MPTIGDFFHHAFKGLGLDESAPVLVDFLQTEVAKKEIPTDNPEKAWKVFTSHFMSFEDALENPGLKKKLEGAGAGRVKEMNEKGLLQWAKDSGYDERTIEALIKEHQDPKTRYPLIYNAIAEMGKATVEAGPDKKEWESKLTRITAENAAKLKEATDKANAIERQLTETEARYKRMEDVRSLSEYIKETMPITGPKVLANPFYKNTAESILSSYHVTHSQSGEWSLYELSSPNTPVTDPKTGHLLKITDVLSTKIPTDLLKKQEDNGGGNGNTTTVTVTGQGNDAPKLNKTQAAWVEQNRQRFGKR